MLVKSPCDAAGLSGFGATHFDIGGYTSIVGGGSEESVSAEVTMVRTEELLLRGAEAAVFTPVFRSHEGKSLTILFKRLEEGAPQLLMGCREVRYSC